MGGSMEVLQKTKNRPTIQYSDTTPGYILKECKSGYNRHLHTYVYRSAINNSQAMENSQDAPLLTKGFRKCSIYTQWSIVSHKEE
jgi:hypothetical protein